VPAAPRRARGPRVILPAMIDPITVSVLTHRFEAIVQEMGEACCATAYSQILNSQPRLLDGDL